MAKGKAPDRGFPEKSMPGLDPVLRAWFRDVNEKLLNIYPYTFQITGAGQHKEGWGLTMADDSIFVCANLTTGLADNGDHISLFEVGTLKASGGSIVAPPVDWILAGLDDNGDKVPGMFYQFSVSPINPTTITWTVGTTELFLFAQGTAGLTINHTGILIYRYVEQP